MGMGQQVYLCNRFSERRIMRLKQYLKLVRRGFPELVGHELAGQAPFYVTELSMAKDTDIEYERSPNTFKAKVSFMVDDNEIEWYYMALFADYAYPNESEGRTWGISFSGDIYQTTAPGLNKSAVALKTFAAMIEVTKKFFKTENPEVVHFTALGKSRLKLYDKFAKLIEKHGYKSTKSKLLSGEKWRFEKI